MRVPIDDVRPGDDDSDDGDDVTRVSISPLETMLADGGAEDAWRMLPMFVADRAAGAPVGFRVSRYDGV